MEYYETFEIEDTTGVGHRRVSRENFDPRPLAPEWEPESIVETNANYKHWRVLLTQRGVTIGCAIRYF